MAKLEDLEFLGIKLGSKCPLSCQHCHNSRSEYIFNNDILPWAKELPRLKRIRFRGGEPLLYWKTILKIVEYLGNDYSYSITTSGCLLTEEMIDFFNNFNVKLNISYDGPESKRDSKKPILWNKLRKVSNIGIAAYTSGTKNVIAINRDTAETLKKYSISKIYPEIDMPKIIHSTLNNRVEITEDEFQTYVRTLKVVLEDEIKKLLNREITESHIVTNAVITWLMEKNYFGVVCANNSTVTITISGNVMLCPYSDIYIGDIYTGINMTKLNNYIPQKCKVCKLFRICRNTCIASDSTRECRVSQIFNEFLHEMEKKYNLDLIKLVTEKQRRT